MPQQKDPPERKSNGNDGDLRVIGHPRRRVDARAKVTGQTRFADDISLPRMAHCKLLRSPHPHARIRSIDISRAAAHPGVYLVLTGKHVPIEYGILPVSQDEQALCLDHVRHVGDPVAAVIAREELTAFEALDLIQVDYEILATINGGGFGGKSNPFNHEIVVAKAALLLDRPVKICLTREEVFYRHRGRHPFLMNFKTGVKKDGTITAMHLQTLIDGGAYGSYGVASTFYTGALQTSTYHVPRYRFQGCRAFTNKPPCGPKRGHGTVQPRFGQEVQLDKIAEKLQIDPADLRLRIAESSNAVTANFFRLSTVNLSECIRRVVKSSGWRDKFRKLPEGRGVGLACSAYLTGAGLPIYWNKMPHSGVHLKFDRGRGVHLFCRATESGQGSGDVLASLVPQVLGLDTFDIRPSTRDTG